MIELKTLEQKVKMMLQTIPDTRNDDRLLIYHVYNNYYGIGFSDMFIDVLRNKNLPSFESIRRTRQRIQASHPELRASDVVKTFRRVNEEEYRTYARGE